VYVWLVQGAMAVREAEAEEEEEGGDEVKSLILIGIILEL
jgi:hypothetical protein